MKKKGLMIKTDGVRIINVSSIGHRFCKQLDLDDLTFERNPAAEKFLQIYGITKLCNILFTRELAKKLEPLGIKLSTAIERKCIVSYSMVE